LTVAGEWPSVSQGGFEATSVAGTAGTVSATIADIARGAADAVATGAGETGSEEEHRERLSRELLRAAAETSDEQTRRMLLDEVVVLNVELAWSIALRYRSRGIPLEDLRQVACLGLIKAARGFDPTVGTAFIAYCVPTIRGEIKRYFRDHGWTVKPPRRVQELQAQIKMAEPELSTALGRPPRPSELAEHLGEQICDVIEALSVNGCFTPSSLDRPVSEDSSMSIGDLLGSDDDDKVAAEARVMLAPAVRRLSERDRKILMLRFFRGWTQSEIAEELGVTQMQVSRLLARILRDLHRGLHPQEHDDKQGHQRSRHVPRQRSEARLRAT
jgi:RNA polymerase sigma-B factor